MKRGIFAIFTVFLLCGCARKLPPAQPPAVALEVRASSPCCPIRSSRDPAVLQQLLWQLRGLDFRGYTHTDGELLTGECWNVELTLSDGRVVCYRLRDGCLCPPGGLWYRIDPRRAEQLGRLLRQLPEAQAFRNAS